MAFASVINEVMSMINQMFFSVYIFYTLGRFIFNRPTNILVLG